MLPIFLVSFCTSVFRHLAVCNTAQSVLCWCVLTNCISGSSFLSTYSTDFVISTELAVSNSIRLLPSCFLGTYKRSTSAFVWCCPWIVSSFLLLRSSFCSPSWYQSIIPKLYSSTGTANDPIAWKVSFALNSVLKTSLNLLKYSFFSFSFSSLCCMSKFSSMPKYLYAFLGSSFYCRSQMCFLHAFCFGHYLFLNI